MGDARIEVSALLQVARSLARAPMHKRRRRQQVSILAATVASDACVQKKEEARRDAQLVDID